MGHSVNCVCVVHLICLNLCVQAGPTRTHQADSKLDQPEHRDSGRLGGQYIHNSLNASRQTKLETFPDSPPGNFWRKEACRSETSWPLFSLTTPTALKTEEHQGQLHQSCRFLPEVSAIRAQI